MDGLHCTFWGEGVPVLLAAGLVTGLTIVARHMAPIAHTSTRTSSHVPLSPFSDTVILDSNIPCGTSFRLSLTFNVQQTSNTAPDNTTYQPLLIYHTEISKLTWTLSSFVNNGSPVLR
jgi:hypothetical protein